MSPSFSNNYSTNHTIYLQDGTLFNFKKRFKRHASTLVQSFFQVNDGRSKFGKRHPLPLMLIILFGGITAGNTTVKDCRIWAIHHQKWLAKVIGSGSLDLIPHGIPDERTLCRAIARLEIDSLVTAFICWRDQLYGLDSSLVASFDGKTLNGVHGKDWIKHILSLFSHKTHQILGQIGVDQKENEIPAFKRLLSEQKPFVSGMLLVGDALHTQKDTASLILESQADYLLFVKGNQEALEQNLALFFNSLSIESPLSKMAKMTFDVDTNRDISRGRDITTQVTSSLDQLTTAYLTKEYGWPKVATIAKVHRFGERIEIDQRTRLSVVHQIDETVYLICSKQLSAKEIAQIVRNHWCIENNLHWEKDYLFLEDRCTLRIGNAPQVMSYLKSCCLSLFALFQFNSASETVSNFKSGPIIQHSFLRMSGVI